MHGHARKVLEARVYCFLKRLFYIQNFIDIRGAIKTIYQIEKLVQCEKKRTLELIVYFERFRQKLEVHS